MLVIREQGSFAFGGTVVTSTDGDTLHADHGYAQFQIPPNARKFPIVMWHGGGQSGRSFESTPDGRPGYQSIFVREGYSTYIIDQPRGGRAGRSTIGTMIADGTPDESRWWGLFRLGHWPDFFPGVQFAGAYSSEALAQYMRAMTPRTGPSFAPADRPVFVDAVTTLLDQIGPSILITHSASGRLGWLTALQSDNLAGIICYETGIYVFPEDEVPPTPAPHEALPVPLSEFLKLTRYPIQLVFGDNIPASPTEPPELDQWRTALVQAQRFVEAVNRHGGDAELLSLPEVGIHGNTHFPFSDLNSDEVAEQLLSFLKEKRLG